MVAAVSNGPPETVLEGVRRFLADFDGVEPVKGITTDLTGEQPGSLALALAGEEKNWIDIAGNRVVRQQFFLYRSCLAQDEADRRQNQAFWERLRLWIEEREEAGVLPLLPTSCRSEAIAWEGAGILEASGGKARFYRGMLTLEYTRMKN